MGIWMEMGMGQDEPPRFFLSSASSSLFCCRFWCHNRLASCQSGPVGWGWSHLSPNLHVLLLIQYLQKPLVGARCNLVADFACFGDALCRWSNDDCRRSCTHFVEMVLISEMGVSIGFTLNTDTHFECSDMVPAILSHLFCEMRLLSVWMSMVSRLTGPSPSPSPSPSPLQSSSPPPPQLPSPSPSSSPSPSPLWPRLDGSIGPHLRRH